MKKILSLLFALAFLTFDSSAQEKVLKILAIGNSFSEDGIENYLHDLAKADGQQIIIGNMYIGGASIELHVKNSRQDKASYSYRKVGLDGKKVTTKDVSISQAIADENWDYISLQQASPYSGQYDVIMKDLPELITYVKSLKKLHTKLLYHQTWAYQHDSKHAGFANYDNSQSKMYSGIVDASKKINKIKDFVMVIPAGTAIQNARTSSQGDTYTRDGYHLELNYGRFTAACTWYEKLFGKDVRKNSYKPEKVTDLQAQIAKQAAHKAVKKPFKISKVNL
ncbi:DUF4886 domain-containing protein [Sphingobacterium litopenaei]|uniref:DUF4886 domain-containing protein n=1 Tax=Sphingobacterium litopenaei TaxID=2763500 RepID=A0ABR7YE47_9SPHI|nr:DUF4886 domain-containing protein [Sphingobacterium litopenaei]MBD1429585.1 DUF4886 domain-containing protein [Sphingobacterium litopenaei]